MALIVGAYFFNSYELVASKSLTYQLMNIFGGIIPAGLSPGRSKHVCL